MAIDRASDQDEVLLLCWKIKQWSHHRHHHPLTQHRRHRRHQAVCYQQMAFTQIAGCMDFAL